MSVNYKKNEPQLGFGIMRFQDSNGNVNFDNVEKTISEYMRGDFCYFDLHPSYVRGMAQNIFKKYVSSIYSRDTYFVANKMPYYGITSSDSYKEIFCDELKACGVNYFDYYMLHAVTEEVYEMHEQFGGFSFLSFVKKNGLVKNIGISFHDKPECLDRILREHPELDFVQLQINYLDWNSSTICSKECYEVALKYQKRIIVMEPIKGGSLTNEIEINNKILSKSELAQYALSFVKTLPGVFVILSGMTDAKQVRENRKTLRTYFHVESNVYLEMKRAIVKRQRIGCTNCGYCRRECPSNIPIPEIISLLNSCSNVGVNDTTFLGRYKIFYRGYIQGRNSKDCIECGKCEARCPQKLTIRQYLREGKAMFDNTDTKYYSSERNVQILVYLLKAYGIKKIVVSPGATNISLVWSIQQDGYFEIYSAIDERSACYMACGLAAESGEGVAISCTGATASRNYLPGLTEAFYRKLPIIAITSTQNTARIGHNIPQVIDRSCIQKDVAKMSVIAKNIKCQEDEWECEININKVLHEAFRKGGGPVHINLETEYSKDFSVKVLPSARIINWFDSRGELPELKVGRIGLYVGAHVAWTDEMKTSVDLFCDKYDAVVIQDPTGNYRGKYGIRSGLLLSQDISIDIPAFDLLICFGEVNGVVMDINANEVWRVSPDGEIRDTFKKLTAVFEMEEEAFFREYVMNGKIQEQKQIKTHQIEEWYQWECKLEKKITQIPFSNMWVASVTAGKLPHNSVLHLAVLNTLRSWNFFRIPDDVICYSNTGGCGIDGSLSSAIGGALTEPNKIHIVVVGDLAFFYDMNSLGNRHLPKNLRIIVINNGGGVEFKNYNHYAMNLESSSVNQYIAAFGHNGVKSETLIRDYAKNLGIEYYSAKDKIEYLNVLPNITTEECGEGVKLLEVFTADFDESEALKIMRTLNGEKKDISISSQKLPRCFENLERPMTIIPWGTGACFKKNISNIERFGEVKYACDSDERKWGQEVGPKIQCISPETLKEVEDVFVVITVEDGKVAFQIAHILKALNIENYDIVQNWLGYANQLRWK